MRMKRILIISAICLGAVNAAFAQSFAHDASKMNQVTVQETGSGSLTPSLYYQLLHNKYRKEAAPTNKLGYRTTAGAAGYLQVDDAEKLDSAMIKRAEIEALNVADRSGGAADIAWMAEKEKITNKLNTFQRNIERIVPARGTTSARRQWREYYDVIVTGLKSTQQAYMPNSQRKKQYLRIYADILRKNETLLNYLVKLSKAKSTSDLLAASYNKADTRCQRVAEAMGRWREVGWSTTVGSKGNGNGGDLIIGPVYPHKWGEWTRIEKDRWLQLHPELREKITTKP